MADETWQDRAWCKRDEMLRQMAADMDVPQELIDRALRGTAAAFADALHWSRVEREAMAHAVELATPVVCAEVTRDWLRPALGAAGFAPQDVERFEVTYVRDDGFRPGLFAQESDGTCAVGYDCPPWPKAEEQ